MTLVTRLKTGLEAGGLAGVAVALLYGATDVMELAPLETVAGLAHSLFDLPVSAVPAGFDIAAFVTTGVGVATYSILHFAAFAVLGLAGTWVVPGRSFWSTLARGGAFGALACSALFYGSRLVSGSPFAFDGLDAKGIVLVNAMAGVIMAVVFAVHTHEEPDLGAD
jgi:hypothetical protein